MNLPPLTFKNALRVIPDKFELGQNSPRSLSMPLLEYREHVEGNAYRVYPDGVRTVMGYQLPTWQRGLVWSERQSIAFIESLWLGVPVGSWTFNRNYDNPHLDNLLIDGQQRMWAIEQYVNNKFKVFDYYWSDVTKVDRRYFDMITFSVFITESSDEEYLKGYYNMMNFGGTAHTEDQRA